MGAFKFVICWIVVALLSMVPLVDPARSAIVSIGDIVLVDTSFITITFSTSIMPQIMSIAIMLAGSFIVYCVYRGSDCTWRKEKVKGDLFVPSAFNDVPSD